MTNAGVPAARAQEAVGISEVRSLVGCWTIEGEEHNSIGEELRQFGTITVVVDSERPNDVTFQGAYEVERATGTYSSTARSRRWRRQIAVDATGRIVRIEDDQPGAAEPTVSAGALSLDGRSLFSTFLFYHPRREMTLFGRERLVIRSPTRVELVAEIEDLFGPYREVYRESWDRRSHDPGSC